jgi:hypothetical protein
MACDDYLFDVGLQCFDCDLNESVTKAPSFVPAKMNVLHGFHHQ